MWDFVGSSDATVLFAIYSSALAIAVTLLLFAAVVALRLRLIAHRRVEQRYMDKWRPILTQIAVQGLDPDTDRELPGLRPDNKEELRFVLNEWNVMHDCLQGVARNNLTRAGYKLALDRVAWAMLENKGTFGDHLMGIVTLGHLEDFGAWNHIEAALDSENPMLSLMAAKALCNIDPDRAMPLLLPRIVARDDWSDARVAGVLQEAGASAVSLPLRDAILESDEEHVEKLIGYLPMIFKPVAATVISRLLRRTVDDRITGACLKVSNSPLELPEVRKLVSHPRWHIRMRVATVLGRIGEEKDSKLLIELLSDPEWWVRYRAAQALAALPRMHTDRLQQIRDALDDPFGRDMLNQVMAERAAT
ncbi:MAG: HEAT repeat domain-containing protein [Gammaproteobacteria bacterium]|nr:HEAT repeat domain-containing protein [Gammaproteobacteria bacterium]